MKRQSGQDNSATAAAAAAVTEDVARDRVPGTDESPAQFCSESSKILRVRASEVALLRYRVAC